MISSKRIAGFILLYWLCGRMDLDDLFGHRYGCANLRLKFAVVITIRSLLR